MTVPYISCICPAYKRPEFTANLVACYLAQDYPKDRCELIIIDDGGNFYSQKRNHEGEEKEWQIISEKKRYATLPDKFNAIIKFAFRIRHGDLFVENDDHVLCIMEDDDVYLPHHLKSIANVHQRGALQFFTLPQVFSTYNQPKGSIQLEGASGRFHAHWAFTKLLYQKVGGYPKTDKLIFDQQMGTKLRDEAAETSYKLENLPPSYIYRWGNPYYHGSAQGEDGYRKLWEALGNRKTEYFGELIPEFDEETELLFQNLIK